MRNRERSAWKQVWASGAMRDKHEFRMSDMRRAANVALLSQKSIGCARRTDAEKPRQMAVSRAL